MNEKQDLVCVFKGQAFEVEVVRARLESEGIPAMIMNNSMSAIFSAYTAMAGPMGVLVNPEDEERARKLIEEQ
ncbi:MAG: DUF2007 domain-containing protein [Bacteroidaceae bacterium]|jgi:hypothetical protein|nr:DUF2007 domain-containing protein [Bacteroidaceae bacterium]MBR4810659.1 DUF2007 domain-containing protein [Bacteroidaceae bacterium]